MGGESPEDMAFSPGRRGLVKPLLFVNWRSVHAGFCAVMWIVAAILAIIVIVHMAVPADAAHHATTNVH
jgi:hypothetical protein